VAHHGSWLDIESLSHGATLNFAMGSSPLQWGTNAADLPPSYGVPLARNFADAFNNHGIGTDGSTDTDGLGADFDGSLHGYSPQALTAAGAAPAKRFSYGGASFVLSGGALDNAVAVGHTIAMPPGTTGRSRVLLGSANNGPSVGTALVTYADGSTTPFTLAFDDRTLNGDGAAPVDPIALTTTYCNARDGNNDGVKTYLFAQSVPLTPGKLVARVTLPKQVSAGKMHVFGISAAP
jgi:hypothetical protein